MFARCTVHSWQYLQRLISPCWAASRRRQLCCGCYRHHAPLLRSPPGLLQALAWGWPTRRVLGAVYNQSAHLISWHCPQPCWALLPRSYFDELSWCSLKPTPETRLPRSPISSTLTVSSAMIEGRLRSLAVLGARSITFWEFWMARCGSVRRREGDSVLYSMTGYL